MRIFQFLLPICILLITGCAPSNHIGKDITNPLLHSAELENAHVGISIYDATDDRNVYQYQSNKYFVPASNTKLFSCYAALKYLGDSLPGIMYAENDTAIILIPTGDPTLLHRDFKYQPVINFLKNSSKKMYVLGSNWKEEPLGFGWAWDDYNSDYMAERSPLPVYGNVIQWVQEITKTGDHNSDSNSTSVYSMPEVSWKIRLNPDASKTFYVVRNRDQNIFEITEGSEQKKEQDVPFITAGINSAVELLRDTVNKNIQVWSQSLLPIQMTIHVIQSQPLDSLLIPMMHRSDNFFAEQCLLMVSQQRLYLMNTSRIIDTLLKSDFKDLPNKPKWVDGSGLSRYNLFSPDDFVWLLKKMKHEIGMPRLQQILPTGGTGTLSNYFKEDRGFVFAKTGTLSGQVALSGFLYTRKNKLFIFSILVNNHNGSATAIRKETELFLKSIRDHY